MNAGGLAEEEDVLAQVQAAGVPEELPAMELSNSLAD